jgi:hypothetical protein
MMHGDGPGLIDWIEISANQRAFRVLILCVKRERQEGRRDEQNYTTDPGSALAHELTSKNLIFCGEKPGGIRNPCTGYLLDHLCMKSLVDYGAESLELQCQKHCTYKPKFKSLYWSDEVFTKVSVQFHA